MCGTTSPREEKGPMDEEVEAGYAMEFPDEGDGLPNFTPVGIKKD